MTITVPTEFVVVKTVQTDKKIFLNSMNILQTVLSIASLDEISASLPSILIAKLQQR